jgi:hypothetical protein
MQAREAEETWRASAATNADSGETNPSSSVQVLCSMPFSRPPAPRENRLQSFAGMRLSYRLMLLVCLFAAGRSAGAQQPAPPASAVPNVTFKFNWDQGRPWVNYTITVAENGATHFSGTANSADSGDADTFQQDFNMSEADRQKIFDWARAADYFQGQFETKQKNIAKTGTKTLEYHGPALNHSITYN